MLRHHSDAAPEELPERVTLHNLEVSWQVWQVMELVNWRWLPDEVLRQPEWLLNDLLAIAAMSGIVRAMMED